jgi:hypothetical protein
VEGEAKRQHEDNHTNPEGEAFCRKSLQQDITIFKRDCAGL